MLDFFLGVAVGAVFAPYWMIVYNKGKELLDSWKTPPAA